MSHVSEGVLFIMLFSRFVTCRFSAGCQWHGRYGCKGYGFVVLRMRVSSEKPFYLLSLAAAMPMSRAFQKSGEGSEGRFDNFLFLSRLLLNSTLFCTNLPLSMQF